MSVEVGVEEVVVDVSVPTYAVEVSVVNPAVEVVAHGTTVVEVQVVDAAVTVSSPSNVVEVSTPQNVVEVILAGHPGKEGTIILNGEGVPDNSLGLDGYYYLDNASDILYGPKLGTWPIAMDPPGLILEHELEEDPHPQYLPETHITDTNPHAQYLPTTHISDVDPHPQYLDATHESALNPHPQYLKAVPVYTHTQGVLAKVWSIRHNLARHPNVVVEDAAGSTIYGTVVYVDTNQLTITFSSSATGHAHCS